MLLLVFFPSKVLHLEAIYIPSFWEKRKHFSVSIICFNVTLMNSMAFRCPKCVLINLTSLLQLNNCSSIVKVSEPPVMATSTWSNDDAASLSTLDRLVAARQSTGGSLSAGKPNASSATAGAAICSASLSRDAEGGSGFEGLSMEARSVSGITRAQGSVIEVSSKTEGSSVLSETSGGTSFTNTAFLSAHITNEKVRLPI